MHGFYNGGFPFMGFGMFFALALFILIIVLLFKGSKDKSDSKEKTAQEILDERYAKGDITLEEYNEKSEAIKKNK